MLIKRRVAVYAHAVDRLVFFAAREIAGSLLESGRAVIAERDDAQIVTALRLAPPRALPIEEMGLWPGSYGAQLESVGETGHYIWQHREAYGELSRAS